MISKHQHSLEGKLPLAVVKEILKTRPKEVDHHDVVVAFDAKPVHVWNANYRDKNRSKLVKILNRAISGPTPESQYIL